MKKWMIVLALIAGSVCFAGSMVAADGGTVATEVATADNGQVCADLDSGKINFSGDSVTVTAPKGKLIDQYCVKAGSANQGDGPIYVTVSPPKESVTITYPGGKDISHYSVSYVDKPTTTEDKPKEDNKKPADETPAEESPANEVAVLPASGA
jgi:hypothetical protein